MDFLGPRPQDWIKGVLLYRHYEFNLYLFPKAMSNLDLMLKNVILKSLGQLKIFPVLFPAVGKFS